MPGNPRAVRTLKGPAQGRPRPDLAPRQARTWPQPALWRRRPVAYTSQNKPFNGMIQILFVKYYQYIIRSPSYPIPSRPQSLHVRRRQSTYPNQPTAVGNGAMRPINVEIPTDDYRRRQIKCQDACPMGTDARGYVRAIARGDFDQAPGSMAIFSTRLAARLTYQGLVYRASHSTIRVWSLAQAARGQAEPN